MVAGAATSFAPRHIAIAPAIAALPAPASMSSSSPSPPPPNGLLGKAARTGGGGAHARKLTAGSSPASSKGTRAQQAAAVAAAATVTSADKVSKDPKEPVDDQEKCCHHDKVRSDRLKVACMTPGCVKVFCTRCLELHYSFIEVPSGADPRVLCPYCRKICTCARCRRDRGEAPPPVPRNPKDREKAAQGTQATPSIETPAHQPPRRPAPAPTPAPAPSRATENERIARTSAGLVIKVKMPKHEDSGPAHHEHQRSGDARKRGRQHRRQDFKVEIPLTPRKNGAARGSARVAQHRRRPGAAHFLLASGSSLTGSSREESDVSDMPSDAETGDEEDEDFESYDPAIDDDDDVSFGTVGAGGNSHAANNGRNGVTNGTSTPHLSSSAASASRIFTEATWHEGPERRKRRAMEGATDPGPRRKPRGGLLRRRVSVSPSQLPTSTAASQTIDPLYLDAPIRSRSRPPVTEMPEGTPVPGSSSLSSSVDLSAIAMSSSAPADMGMHSSGGESAGVVSSMPLDAQPLMSTASSEDAEMTLTGVTGDGTDGGADDDGGFFSARSESKILHSLAPNASSAATTDEQHGEDVDMEDVAPNSLDVVAAELMSDSTGTPGDTDDAAPFDPDEDDSSGPSALSLGELFKSVVNAPAMESGEGVGPTSRSAPASSNMFNTSSAFSMPATVTSGFACDIELERPWYDVLTTGFDAKPSLAWS